ncbi:MAG: hypothetical protein FJ026_17355 [Chloroflexi bacterium]|nr:hypothetical protein [Chloroflexota bacterium]
MIACRLLGLTNALAYGLRRAKLGFVQLNIGVVVLCLLLAGYSGLRGWLAGLTVVHGFFMVVPLLVIFVLIRAEIHHYVLFRPGHATEAVETALLPPETKLFLRGSGLFEVSNMHRYLVEVPVVFWATELSEYVLAAKVRAKNVLGLGVPAVERGWWYIFLEPRRVRRIVRGELYFGLRRRAAVCISYETERAVRAVYLSSEDPRQVALVVHDMQSRARTP